MGRRKSERVLVARVCLLQEMSDAPGDVAVARSRSFHKSMRCAWMRSCHEVRVMLSA